MGTEICQNCNGSKNMYIEKNLSNKNFLENEKAINGINHLIKNQNKSENKIENDISTNINNNENDNNASHYDNPLYNTSLDESMNLGNCYIGTNKNNTKIKPYVPDNSLQIMNRKRLSLESKSNESEFNFKKRMNKTSKNFNKRKIKYNLFFNNENINDIDEYPENILENGYFYNNSNKKNNFKFNNMSFYNDAEGNKSKSNVEQSLENINKLVKNISFKKLGKDKTNNNTINNNINNNNISNNNNDSNINNNINNNNKNNINNNINNKKEIKEIAPENNNEDIINKKLKNILMKYNVQKLKKIINKLFITKNIKNIDNNINNENKELLDIKQYNEEYETIKGELNFEDLDINLIPEKKHIFIGIKQNNLKQGLGLDIFKSFNSYFFGQFINGKRCGLGKYSINNQNHNYIYKGEINGAYANGYGQFINNEILMNYEGEWKNSLKDGIGIETYKKNFYQGEFVNGKRNGIGEYFWEKDVFYIGEWKDNLMNGEGIYYFSKEAWYEGSFKNNKMEGFGILNVKNSKIYAGFYKNDYKDGFGIKIWDNDKKAYVGFWKNNKQEGFGKFFKKDKIKYAIYKDGIIVNEINDNENINKIYSDINKYFSLLFELRNYNEVKDKVYEYINM